MPAEEKADVESRVATRRRPTSDQPAAGRETLEALGPCGFADMLEDYINAAPFRELLYLGGDVLLVVIDDMIGAERFRLRKFGFATGSRNDAAVEQFGKLHRGHPHAARSCQHQHVFTRLEFRAAKKH